MKPSGEFDYDYCRKIQDAYLKAILEASIDPATNTAMLRNAEIAKALLRISATLTATSKEASSPTQIRHLAEDYAKDFRRLVAANRAELDKTRDPPFAVLHPDELQQSKGDGNLQLTDPHELMNNFAKNGERIKSANFYAASMVSPNPKQLSLFSGDTKKRVLSDKLTIDRGSRPQVLLEAVVRTELKSASKQDSSLVAVSGSDSAQVAPNPSMQNRAPEFPIDDDLPKQPFRSLLTFWS